MCGLSRESPFPRCLTWCNWKRDSVSGRLSRSPANSFKTSCHAGKTVGRQLLPHGYAAPVRHTRAEVKARFVTIVFFAQQTKVLDRRLAANREGDDVVEFEEAARRTAPIVCAHEGAAPQVAQPDCA